MELKIKTTEYCIVLLPEDGTNGLCGDVFDIVSPSGFPILDEVIDLF